MVWLLPNKIYLRLLEATIVVDIVDFNDIVVVLVVVADHIILSCGQYKFL